MEWAQLKAMFGKKKAPGGGGGSGAPASAPGVATPRGPVDASRVAGPQLAAERTVAATGDAGRPHGADPAFTASAPVARNRSVSPGPRLPDADMESEPSPGPQLPDGAPPAGSPSPSPGPPPPPPSSSGLDVDSSAPKDGHRSDAERGGEAQVDREGGSSGGSDDSGDSDDSDDSDGDSRLPVSYSVQLAAHTKGVTALSADPSGARVVTGGFDFQVNMYDFGGMDSRFRPFRTLEPCGAHQIRALEFSESGDQFLVVPASNRAKILSRDGAVLAEFNKGDMYLVDLANTKGHIGPQTAGGYSPLDRNIVMTASEDSTIRLWDLNDVDRNRNVIKHRTSRGMKAAVTAAAFSPDGRLLAAGCTEPSVQLWSAAGPFARPQMLIRESGASYDTTGVAVSRDRTLLLQRCSDDALRVWDLRKLSQPLMVDSTLSNFYEQTNAVFSPSEDHFITGCSVRKGQGVSRLVVYSRATLKPVREVPVHASVIRCLWHARINQVFVSTSEGGTHVFYDPSYSARGALLCAGRTARRTDAVIDGGTLSGPVIAPHAMGGRKRRARGAAVVEQEAGAVMRPQLPPPREAGGGPAAHGGSVFTKYLVKNLGSVPDLGADPREAILKYAEEAKSDPVFTKAYARTQPVKIFETEDGRIIRK